MRDDLVLCSIVINGSGQDSGEVDYQIHCGAMQRVCLERKEDVVDAIKKLLSTVIRTYGKV